MLCRYSCVQSLREKLNVLLFFFCCCCCWRSSPSTISVPERSRDPIKRMKESTVYESGGFAWPVVQNRLLLYTECLVSTRKHVQGDGRQQYDNKKKIHNTYIRDWKESSGPFAVFMVIRYAFFRGLFCPLLVGIINWHGVRSAREYKTHRGRILCNCERILYSRAWES